MKNQIVVLLATFGLALSASAAFANQPGDCNGDGVIDAADTAVVQAALGTVEGDEGFVPEADHNGDGLISAADLGDQLRLADGK